MKKILSALLCCCILFAAAGCAKQPPAPETTLAPTVPATQPSTQSPAQPTQPVQNGQPLTALTLKTTRESVQSQDGTDIFYFDSQVVYLLTQDTAVTETVTLDLINRIDRVRAASESIQEAADAAYTPDAGSWIPFFSQISYTPTRIDVGVLSLLGEEALIPEGFTPTIWTPPSTMIC